MTPERPEPELTPQLRPEPHAVPGLQPVETRGAAGQGAVTPPAVPARRKDPSTTRPPGGDDEAGAAVGGGSDDRAEFEKAHERWGRTKADLRKWAFGFVGLAAAAVVGAALLGPTARVETGGEQAAVRRLDAGHHDLGRLRSGTIEVVAGLYLSAAELDAGTTDAVRSALARGDDAAADRAFQEAQALTPVKDPRGQGATARTLQPMPPRLTAEQKQAIRRDEAALYRLNLWDCCDEDGDVIQVLLNGVPYATVPLQRATTTVLVPLPKGGTANLAVRGVRDGEGGGVTTGLHTGAGDFLLRSIGEGEVVPLRTATPGGAGTR